MIWLPFALAAVIGAARPDPLPEVIVDHDNVTIDRSCRVVIPADLVIADTDGNGVIHIQTAHITVEFADGSVLRGAPPMPAVADDALSGAGIRVADADGVTLAGARVEGYKAAIHATNADHLTIDRARIDRNFRQHLRSTPMAEDQADWLWPHKNDDGEWLSNYGAAVCIERSSGVTVRGVRVRNSQNGIILDRVQDSSIDDNDCSFLSGWGLAMWRSSRNTISRNAFDFCIRGYSHGVYNRGQDSAGILCFEQCSDNIVIENSATHCGDGFFGFAGREALGEAPSPDAAFTYDGRGCNNNSFFANDLSFAAAHGLELTFSFSNRIVNNRLCGNAICGVWAGYSQDTVLHSNTIEDNGAPGAREGGGINIEHGGSNAIVSNNFARNSVAVSLWSDADEQIMKLPWSAANHRGSAHNIISLNQFREEPVPVRLRLTRDTLLLDNRFADSPDHADVDAASNILTKDPAEASLACCTAARLTPPSAIGDSRPINARASLAGRQHIIMGEWGPWDHQSPMLRLSSRTSDRAMCELYGDTGPVTIDVLEGKGDLETDLGAVEENQPRTLVLRPRTGIQVLPYAVRVRARNIDQTLRGTLTHSQWTATVFAFTADPRTNLDQWRAESRSAAAVTVPCDDLAWMSHLGRGPADLPMFREAAREGRVPGRERYGVIARTKLELPAGSWRFTTLSDDGVRILVNGATVLENWTHHGPERNQGSFTQAQPGPVEIVVEYFQLDGYAVLEFELGKDGTPAPPTAVP